jgi:hypothetical protein
MLKLPLLPLFRADCKMLVIVVFLLSCEQGAKCEVEHPASSFANAVFEDLQPRKSLLKYSCGQPLRNTF